jgi:hypothetical protein
MPHPPEYRYAFAALALFCLQGSADAQIPEPRLYTLGTPGACSGGTSQLSLTGVDLEEAVLRFSHPGITAVRDAQKPLSFAVSVAADVPPGLYDVRAVGLHGVTNPRRFEVSALSELDASAKAVSRDVSQEVTAPCVIRGAALKQGIQWFKLKAAAHRELVFDCHAAQLDSRLEPQLVLYDGQGRELARSRTRPIHWTPAAEETLYLALRDFIGNGGPEHFYRLYICGPDPVPGPPGRQPLVFWEPSPRAVSEAEPNDPARPLQAPLPLAVRGTFSPAKDVDTFEFAAKKGETWWVECLSQRLGAPTLPRVVVERVVGTADGKSSIQDSTEIKAVPLFPGDPDFDGHHFDPVGPFTAKEDGLHRLVLRDLNNTLATGPARPYVLEVRKAVADFALLVCVQPPVPNKAFMSFTGPLVSVRAANIRPNQVLPLRVLVVRRDGFEGEIQLSAEELPEGLSAAPVVLGAKQTEGTLLLAAGPTAAPWTGAIRVSGRAQVGGDALVRVAATTTPLWESTASEFVEPPRSRLASEMTVAIVGDAPFPSALHAAQPTSETAVSGKVKIGLRVERHASSGPAVALKFKPLGIPGLEKAKEIEVPAKEGLAEYELDLAPLKLAPGTYTVWFRGEEKAKRTVKGKEADATYVLCSNPILLNLKEPAKP